MPVEWPKLLRAVRASLQVASLLYGPGSGMGAVSGPRLGRSQVRGWGRPSRSAGQVGVFQAPQSIQCGPTLHRSGPLTITTLQRILWLNRLTPAAPISAVNGPVPAQTSDHTDSKSGLSPARRRGRVAVSGGGHGSVEVDRIAGAVTLIISLPKSATTART